MRIRPFFSVRRCARTALLALAAVAAGTPAHAASLSWTWSYAGAGITASGTFVTGDTPDALGYYLITGIAGTRNGETITGLQPAGTSVPGNEPFHVDNLVRLGTEQLTGDGFGYSTSGGNYATPFFASFLPTPGYLEVFSAPPFIPGASNLGPEDSELPVNFTATLLTIPEPGSYALALAGLAALGALRGRARMAAGAHRLGA